MSNFVVASRSKKARPTQDYHWHMFLTKGLCCFTHFQGQGLEHPFLLRILIKIRIKSHISANNYSCGARFAHLADNVERKALTNVSILNVHRSVGEVAGSSTDRDWVAILGACTDELRK